MLLSISFFGIACVSFQTILTEKGVLMVPRMVLIVTLLLSQSAVAQNPGSSKQSASVTAEITKLENQIWEYWKTQKYDAMKTLIADDAIVVGSDGYQTTNQMIEENKKRACIVKGVSLQNVKVMMICQDAAIITYKAIADGTCGGKPLSPTGDMNTSVWIKRGNNWLTVSHHQSPATK